VYQYFQNAHMTNFSSHMHMMTGPTNRNKPLLIISSHIHMITGAVKRKDPIPIFSSHILIITGPINRNKPIPISLSNMNTMTGPINRNKTIPILSFHMNIRYKFSLLVLITRPPLWSSGQSFWLQRFRVRFPALLDFLRSSGTGT
jgi:hypothetical protein